MSRLLKSGTFWFTVLAIALLVAGAVLSIVFWSWLHPNTPAEASTSTTLRNVGLLIGGVLALVFAVWRSWVAERQTATAQESLLNDQYQRGADMLGSRVLSVRMGGIYVLKRLAETHPKQYHVPVMELFCVFARHPTMEPDLGPDSLQEDVQAVMTAIGGRSKAGLEFERAESYQLELHGADLRHANLYGTNLAGANLSGARLNDAILLGANLSCAVLVKANLTRANATQAKLCWADLSKARLHDTNLSGAVFRERATHEKPSFPCPPIGDVVSAGLTQFQLHLAYADPDNPPKLDGVLDAETGNPLVWRGQPCHKNQELEG